MDERPAKGVPLQGCSRSSSDSVECTAGGHRWWLPEMF